MKSNIQISIDPGKSGGMAVKIEEVFFVYKCPETQPDMISFLKDMKDICVVEGWTIEAVVEKVGPRGTDGRASMWKFCQNYTTWVAGLIALDIPFTEISPQEWMKKLGGVPNGKDKKKERKNYIKEKMQKAYPSIKKDITLATSDALAILHVCQG